MDSVPFYTEAVVSSNRSYIGMQGVYRSEDSFGDCDDAVTLPDHSADWSRCARLDKLRIVGQALQARIMCFDFDFVGLTELHRYELETALFKSQHNFVYEVPLDRVWLHHYETSFLVCGHLFNTCHQTWTELIY